MEDILQQDPREKLELFPKLGYYFISFRAIESNVTRDRIRRKNADIADASDEGPVGESNVYLAVFHEGICCVNFVRYSSKVTTNFPVCSFILPIFLVCKLYSTNAHLSNAPPQNILTVSEIGSYFWRTSLICLQVHHHYLFYMVQPDPF